MVCLDNFVEFSIFNFVIGHTRKFPSGLTELHEADWYLSGPEMINWRREVDN